MKVNKLFYCVKIYTDMITIALHSISIRAPDNFQVQRVITPYFWKWWVFAYFLSTVVSNTCTLLKLCLTQVLFNKRRMQVKCLIWHYCVMFINKMLLIFCSVFTLYDWLITFSCFLFSLLLVDFGSFHSRFDNVINDSFNYTVTRHS